MSKSIDTATLNLPKCKVPFVEALYVGVHYAR